MHLTDYVDRADHVSPEHFKKRSALGRNHSNACAFAHSVSAPVSQHMSLAFADWLLLDSTTGAAFTAASVGSIDESLKTAST